MYRLVIIAVVRNLYMYVQYMYIMIIFAQTKLSIIIKLSSIEHVFIYAT